MNPDIDNDPVTDLDRLVEISRYDLFSDEVHRVLDRFAQRGAEQFDMPIALVSIVLDGAQYLAGSHGVGGWIGDAEGVPIEWSFCANAVRNRGTYIVEDATVDELQHDNPVVLRDGIRSYAGAPLTTSNGQVLGAYCVVGVTPHHFTTDEITELETAAAEVVAEIERHRL